MTPHTAALIAEVQQAVGPGGLYHNTSMQRLADALVDTVTRMDAVLTSAKAYIDESPCDYDITVQQTTAWFAYQEALKAMP